MSGILIRCHSIAFGLQPCPEAGQYLASLDVDARDGRGRFTWTEHRSVALVFEDRPAAHRAWLTQSTVRPLRPDGKPNRPLTAFTVLLIDTEDDDA